MDIKSKNQKCYINLDRSSMAFNHYDFENDDVISLNVDGDYSQDDGEQIKSPKLQTKSNQHNNSSQLDSGCCTDTYKFELNPQKYSLELSTLSSSSSSSSSLSSISSSINKKLSSNSLNSNLSKLDSSLSYIVKFHRTNNQSPKTINNKTTDSSIFTKISSASSSEPTILDNTKNVNNNNINKKKKLIKRNASHLGNNERTSNEINCYRLKPNRTESFKVNNNNNNKQTENNHRIHKKVVTVNQTKVNNKNKTANILDLDDYLLVKIFSKLTTLDKLLLQFVCKRFFFIIWSNLHAYKLFKRIEIIQTHNVASIYHYFNNLHQSNTNHIKSSLMTRNRIFDFFRRKKTDSSSKSTTTAAVTFRSKVKLVINADLVLKFLLTKLLNRQTFPLCLCVEFISIKDNHRLTDRGIDLIGQFCPELTYLCIKNCLNIKTNSIMRVVSNCENIKYLNLTGCIQIENVAVLNNNEIKVFNNNNNNSIRSNISKKLNYYLNNQSNASKTCETSNLEFLINNQIKINYLYLHFIDLSYCTNVTDICIQNISKTCVYLRNFYLRKCRLITDISLLYIAKYCLNLRELSLSQCNKITDLGVKFLGNDPMLTNSTAMNDYLSHNELDKCRFKMKYLSFAKCTLITDKSLIYLCKLGYFQQIKYFNLRGCTLVTDKFMKYFTGAQFIQKIKLNFQSGNSEQMNYLNLEKNKVFPFQLVSLDLAKCQITDKSIEYICRLISIKPNILHRFSLRNCDQITDKGIKLLALTCSHLEHLNVTKCSNITSKSLKEIKINCKSCIIQHTNFSFC